MIFPLMSIFKCSKVSLVTIKWKPPFLVKLFSFRALKFRESSCLAGPHTVLTTAQMSCLRNSHFNGSRTKSHTCIAKRSAFSSARGTELLLIQSLWVSLTILSSSSIDLFVADCTVVIRATVSETVPVPVLRLKKGSGYVRYRKFV